MNNIDMVTSLLEKEVMGRVLANSEMLAESIAETLRTEVESTVYEAYDPKHYQRTNALIDSIESKVKNDGVNNIRLEAIFSTDADYSHTALLDTPRMGISAGDSVYIPEWVNEGYTWRGQASGEKKPAHFIEKTYEAVTVGSNSVLNKIEKLIK